MTYRVTIYCPDRHIVYDGRTPREKGVGGGITARVRLASALARAGNEVTAIVNCEREMRVDGVDYLPLGTRRPIVGDVVVANTSGGLLDLRPLSSEDVSAKLMVLWASSLREPTGLREIAFDWTYAKSNFQSSAIAEAWGLDPSRLAVIYNGFDQESHRGAELRSPTRDPHRIVFISHPIKGYETAVAVTKLVREKDPRFHLEVYGGMELWGGISETLDCPDGVKFHGLIGQSRLALALREASYAICLHSIPDTFGNVVIESMRAGCIVIASPVGAQTELIRDNETGLLIEGDHYEASVRDAAAGRILDLAASPEATERIRRSATSIPWSSDRMAEAWIGHWDWVLDRPTELARTSAEACRRCGGEQLILADGYHCRMCGTYRSVAVAGR